MRASKQHIVTFLRWVFFPFFGLIIAACSGGGSGTMPAPASQPNNAAPGFAQQQQNATKIYVTSNEASVVQVFDENGGSINAPGGFPGIFLPRGIAFDSSNHHLYIINTHQSGTLFFQVVDVYDEEGNRVTTSGTFSGLRDPLGIAFDSANHRLYVTDGFTVRVFDEDGNPIAGCTFPNLRNATGIAFDSANRRLYVTNAQLCGTSGCTRSVNAYDEQGNPIKVSGGFPNLTDPAGIAIDSSKGQVFIADSILATVRVYDENGSLVTVSGTFPTLFAPYDIAFDPTNQRLYVTDTGAGSVKVFDEVGNNIASFPVVQIDKTIINIAVATP